MDEAKELIYDALAMAALTHHWHLTITGPGSYAAHVTLGDLYNYCHDIADTLGEKLQGSGVELDPKGEARSIPFSPPDIKNIIKITTQFAEAFEDVTEPPWLANIAQEIQGVLYGHLYKLKRLS